MRAVTFQEPEPVEVVDKPEPELLAPDDAIVRVTATGVCGSDLHIYHGRVQIEPGLHDRPRVRRRGRRRGRRRHERRGRRRGARLLPGRVRHVLVLPPRRLPQVRAVAHVRPRRGARRSAGDAGRARARAAREPDAAARAGGPVARGRAVRRRRHGHRLPRRRRRPACARATPSPCSASARSASARCRRPCSRARRRSSRSTPSRTGSRWPRPSARSAVHLTEEDPRAAVEGRDRGRGVDVAIDAVGDPRALELAIRLARKCGTVSASASTPSAARSTWASPGSRR